jgi:hypothetical protein
MVRCANNTVIASGTAMIILGFLIIPIFPISVVLTLTIGNGVLYLGARGKPGYFQLITHNMPKPVGNTGRWITIDPATSSLQWASLLAKCPTFNSLLRDHRSPTQGNPDKSN